MVAPFTVFGWFGVGPKWSYIEPFWSKTGLLLKLHTLSYDCHVTQSHCNWPPHYSLYYATCIYVHVSTTTVLAVCVCVCHKNWRMLANSLSRPSTTEPEEARQGRLRRRRECDGEQCALETVEQRETRLARHASTSSEERNVHHQQLKSLSVSTLEQYIPWSDFPKSVADLEMCKRGFHFPLSNLADFHISQLCMCTRKSGQ